jgi:WhiB family redox-sensing transcriptional regulator
MNDIVWMEKAACSEKDPTSTIFFPEVGQSGYQTRSVYAEAARLCLSCPVKQECLEYALDNGLGHGMWGGKTPLQRRAINRSGQLRVQHVG